MYTRDDWRRSVQRWWRENALRLHLVTQRGA